MPFLGTYDDQRRGFPPTPLATDMMIGLAARFGRPNLRPSADDLVCAPSYRVDQQIKLQTGIFMLSRGVDRRFLARRVSLPIFVGRHKLNRGPCIRHFACYRFLRTCRAREPNVLLSYEGAVMYLTFDNR
jgi:hypothetical protein